MKFYLSQRWGNKSYGEIWHHHKFIHSLWLSLSFYILNNLHYNLTSSLHSIIGLSCKTQEMYLLVFCVRYLDLFMYFISVYNTTMKIFFISASAFTIYLMRFKKPYCTVSNTPLLPITRPLNTTIYCAFYLYYPLIFILISI